MLSIYYISGHIVFVISFSPYINPERQNYYFKEYAWSKEGEISLLWIVLYLSSFPTYQVTENKMRLEEIKDWLQPTLSES